MGVRKDAWRPALEARRLARLRPPDRGPVRITAFADGLRLPTHRELIGDGMEFLTRYPAAPLAAFSFGTPIFGMLAGALLLGEPVTHALALAMVFVAAGTYLVNRG